MSKSSEKLLESVVSEILSHLNELDIVNDESERKENQIITIVIYI